MASIDNYTWHKVAELNDLPEGRVKTINIGTRWLALTHHNGKYGALDNHCPHQGGPLGEGSIEKGHLRCPWHGWDFCPLTGKAPGFDDGVTAYPTEVRDDGVYVAVPPIVEDPKTISDLMVETMINWGVTHVFGIVGHSNLGFAEAMRKAEKAGKLTYIGVRHEGVAAFACSGYAKLTGKPAACFAIAGPGATNLLTGMWDAKVDRAPLLALTGQVNTQVLGPGAFQEIDLKSAFESVSQFNQTVLHDSDHVELMNLALKNAIVKRDVANLIFPDEVQVLKAEKDKTASGPEGRLGDEEITPSPQSISQAVDAINNSKRPVVVMGFGARQSKSEVVAFAEKLNAPVITTFKGKGLISDQHPLAGGVLGRSGTPIASWFMNESDLMIVFGSSFSNHTGITSKKKLIQIDFDRMQLGKFHKVDIPVWGEIGQTASILSEKINPEHASGRQSKKELAARKEIWKAEKTSRQKDNSGKGINSAAIFQALQETVPDDAVLAVDVGNNTYSFGRYFETKAQSVLMSGYLGSIGFAFAAAIGAWCAEGDKRKIVSISGDGGFGQYLADFTTAVKYKMDITHVLLNNCELGKITKEQRASEYEKWQTSLHNPNFAEFAENCGALGIRVTKQEDLENAFKKALSHPGPALVEIMSDAKLI